MKIYFYVMTILLMATSCTGKIYGDKTLVTFTPDTVSNLKNPYMGWTLYSERRFRHTNGKEYWEKQNEAAEKYAGTFYLRWTWDEMEKEEGIYAWDNDSVFINLVQGALNRNIRLAFRVFTHGGTPKYVMDKAETYNHMGNAVVYADDPVFLEKYTKFIEAFGKRFNNPAIVDYVDCSGLGLWGEEHNIRYKTPENKHRVHEIVSKAYAKAFDKVINVVNYGVRDEEQIKLAFDELKFSPRRDGFGSKWFPEKDRLDFVKYFPERIIIAEACYLGNGPIEYHKQNEGRIVWTSWREYYDEVVNLALKSHANYLDMRTTVETERYMNEATEAANLFLKRGGYRIYPEEISYSTNDSTIYINHTWKNIGVGVLPNNNVNLRNKYKVSFALFDKNNNIVKKFISNNIEVSQLINGKTISATDKFEIGQKTEDGYKLGIGIINQLENDSKDIALSINNPVKITGEWVYIGTVLDSKL